MTQDQPGNCEIAAASPKLSRRVCDDLSDTEKSGLPLNSSWTLWLDRSVPGTTASQYEATLRKVYTFSTIESFWAVFNNIPKPSDVAARYSYHLMRHVSRPRWEDAGNKNGGVWKLKCYKWATNSLWKMLLLDAIGEKLSDNVADGDDILGVSVSIRENEDLIQIWNANAQMNEKACIHDRHKELAPDVNFPVFFYKAHQQHHAFEGRRF